MADSSLRRFFNKVVPGRTTNYDSGYRQPQKAEWGIPGMTKPGVDYSKPKASGWNAKNTRGAHFIKKNK